MNDRACFALQTWICYGTDKLPHTRQLYARLAWYQNDGFHHQTSTTSFSLTPCLSCFIPLQFPICFYPLPCSPLSSHLISPSNNLVLFVPNPRYQRPDLAGTKRQHPCPPYQWHRHGTTLTWRSWLPWLLAAYCSAAPAPSRVKEEVKGKGKVEEPVA